MSIMMLVGVALRKLLLSFFQLVRTNGGPFCIKAEFLGSWLIQDIGQLSGCHGSKNRRRYLFCLLGGIEARWTQTAF